MKFSAVLSIAGFAAIAAALPQGSETTDTAATITAAPTSWSYSVDPAYASTLSCISACGAGNVYCAAGCQGLPIPDEAALNATYDCIAACPPGGDDEKNAAWAVCQQGCVASNYYTASQTYTDAYAIPTNTNADDSDPSGTGSDSVTETGDASKASKTSGSPSASETPNAGSSIFANIPMVGALGLLLGALAL